MVLYFNIHKTFFKVLTYWVPTVHFISSKSINRSAAGEQISHFLVFVFTYLRSLASLLNGTSGQGGANEKEL